MWQANRYPHLESPRQGEETEDAEMRPRGRRDQPSTSANMGAEEPALHGCD
jgi:hypothetical protein